MNYAKRHNSSDDIYFLICLRKVTLFRSTTTQNIPLNQQWCKRLLPKVSWFSVNSPGLVTIVGESGSQRQNHLFHLCLSGSPAYIHTRCPRVLEMFTFSRSQEFWRSLPIRKWSKKVLMKISKIHFFLGHPVLGKYIHVIWGTWLAHIFMVKLLLFAVF